MRLPFSEGIFPQQSLRPPHHHRHQQAAVDDLSDIRRHRTRHPDESQEFWQDDQNDRPQNRPPQTSSSANNHDGDDEDGLHHRETSRIDEADVVCIKDTGNRSQTGARDAPVLIRTDQNGPDKLTELVKAQLINPGPLSPPKSGKIRADDEFIRNYDNLKKFIIRPNLHGNPVLIEAVHPEDPYTFKPLLKRLVCLDCHAPERDIDKIKHADGKSHRIKFFYGPIEETKDEKHPF